MMLIGDFSLVSISALSFLQTSKLVTESASSM